MTAEPPPEPTTAPQPGGGAGLSLASQPLRSLIDSYDHAVIFRESLPSPFALAKLFTEMEENHGGLVLVGLDRDGNVEGVSAEDLEHTWSRFERLCSHLTDTRVKLGTLQVKDKTVVFLVFNTLPRNLLPFSHYRTSIDRTCWI